MIRSGRADVVLAGGTEAAILPLNVAGVRRDAGLSTRNDEPERASRPFDKGRDGFVLGEGAGIVVLESAEHAARARRRGATRSRPGVGYSADAHHIAQPEPEAPGLGMAMRQALADAGVAAGQSCTSTRTPRRPRPATWSRCSAISRAIGDARAGRRRPPSR